MRISHLVAENEVQARKEDAPPAAFFLRNQAGSMLSFYPERQSRYEGWYIPGFHKILERIEVDGNPQVNQLSVSSEAAFWELDGGLHMGWKLHNGTNGLLIRFSKITGARIHLDMRHIYQFPSMGRDYQIVQESEGLLVRYNDPSLSTTLYAHIRSNQGLTLSQAWKKQQYSRDAARNSAPSSLYSFDVGHLESTYFAIGAGTSPQEAIAASKQAFAMDLEFPSQAPTFSHTTLLTEIAAAKTSTIQALKWLQTEEGIWAGLPWFHQVWSRDELIAALGFERNMQRQVIETYLGFPLENGELPTFQGSGTTCADGVGWLCLLIRQYGEMELSEETKGRLVRFLKVARLQLKQNRMGAHGLIYSGHNATWMDTIGREGCRLEIQCMYALALELLFELTGDSEFERERISFLGKIRTHFWARTHLGDGLGDHTIRPNIFIAYLLQADLLTDQAWQTCFDTATTTLSCHWGGLSSLDPSDPRFLAQSTGENNHSYHNGDSWFFVNNLAAIALQRLNHRRYGKVIVGILQSSTTEILWHNMAGQAGEISSAGSLESWGRGIQAFSGGAYLALLNELEENTGLDSRQLSGFWESH